jgi:hypothetical protein
MALTDNEREKKIKRTKKKSLTAEGNFRWSDKQKMEAVTSWLALGNLALVSRLSGIPEVTLRVWKASTWWKELVEELKMQESIQLSSRMKQLVEASQTIVAQRLESGDPILNQKTGEIVYKPVSMKDAHKVAVDLIDRKKELDKLTSDDVVTDERADDKLTKLAEKFAEMATRSIEKNLNKQRTIDADDVEIIERDAHAVHEEREARLREGIQGISFEAGADQESDGTDDGTEAS